MKAGKGESIDIVIRKRDGRGTALDDTEQYMAKVRRNKSNLCTNGREALPRRDVNVSG